MIACPMQTMSFDDWVRAWFDHPDDWDWVCDFPLVELSPDTTLAYTTQLFQNAGALLAAYSDTQVGKGLHALIWEGDSPLTILQDTSLPRAECRACLKSIYRVYKEIFAVRCPEVCSARARGELSHVCFMWWDIFPLYYSYHPALNETVLTTLERTLGLPHLACQEAALHGLGHWHYANPARVEGIIDAFLATQKRCRPELVSYARAARAGRVL
ncbi:hypothetical protein [Armatimonas rosea]|uniref:Uncharacterized protein n=1 Tax=Armatimonas rosea TaxID=685828 RepID=A0A7W9SPL7_ARMRO|nr:hypothetical protein [Armatimonas rosea]MBB6049884.1 hypothetical protein [Armatimonas rosea]